MSNIDYTTKGYIYEGVKGDGSPLNRQITERLVCEFMCDVQRDASGTISSGGVSIFLYNIYLDTIDADIKAGYIFKSDKLNGSVVSVWEHEMGLELKVRDNSGGR